MNFGMVSLFPIFVRLSRVAVPLVVLFFFTSQKAVAECGDYVTIVNNSQATPAAVDGDSERVHQPAPVKLPCRGPHCSSPPGHKVPPLAPNVPVSFGVKEIPQPGSPAGSHCQASRKLEPDNKTASPIDRLNSIFHPPRSV